VNVRAPLVGTCGKNLWRGTRGMLVDSRQTAYDAKAIVGAAPGYTACKKSARGRPSGQPRLTLATSRPRPHMAGLGSALLAARGPRGWSAHMRYLQNNNRLMKLEGVGTTAHGLRPVRCRPSRLRPALSHLSNRFPTNFR
jgi:hypothetical protein